TARAVAETDNLVAALSARETPMADTSGTRRGASRGLKFLFFLIFLAGAGWLAAATVKHIPNEVAAGAVAGVGLVAWLLSLLIGRGESTPRPAQGDLEKKIAAAVDSTVMTAVRAEVGSYEKAVADLRAALSH
ncbi:MAG: hypothetical protein ACTHJM_16765, partial [Marmoricola sp.]